MVYCVYVHGKRRQIRVAITEQEPNHATGKGGLDAGAAE